MVRSSRSRLYVRRLEESWMALNFEHYASDMVTVIEADGTIRYQGPALERVLGYRPEEHAGRNVYEFLHPEDVARGEAALAEVLGTPGVSPPVEFRWRHKDGSWRWLESIGNNLLGDPEVRAVVSSSRDVTGRKREEARYEALVENISAGLLIEDESGNIVKVNQVLCEMFGLSGGPEKLAGLSRAELCRLVEPLLADPEGLASRAAELRQSGQPVIAEELALADGRVFELDHASVSVREECRGRMWVCREITARKNAERNVQRERNFLRTVVDSAYDPIFIKDTGHRFLLNNAAHLRALGLQSQEQALGKTNADLWGDRARKFQEDDLRVIQNGEVIYGEEEEIRVHSGQSRWFSTTKVPLIGENGNIEGLVGISRDINRRRAAEDALRESEERYRAVIERAAEGIFLFDAGSGKILETNAALRELLGYTSEELLQMTVYDVIAHAPEEIDESIRRDLEEGSRLAGERSYRRKDGSLVDVEVSMVAVPYRGREILGSVVRDLTGRKRLEEELRHRATHDPLTHLPNRALFNDRLAQALEREKRRGGHTAVLFIDLDGFKAINDRYGHDVGDELLTTAAFRLRNCVRAGDTVSRLGGDEFLVLLEDADTERAEKVSERMIRALEAPLEPEERSSATARYGEHAASTVRLGASIGVALSDGLYERTEEEPEASVMAEALIRTADEAMYRAKRSTGGSAWRS